MIKNNNYSLVIQKRWIVQMPNDFPRTSFWLYFQSASMSFSYSAIPGILKPHHPASQIIKKPSKVSPSAWRQWVSHSSSHSTSFEHSPCQWMIRLLDVKHRNIFVPRNIVDEKVNHLFMRILLKPKFGYKLYMMRF